MEKTDTPEISEDSRSRFNAMMTIGTGLIFTDEGRIAFPDFYAIMKKNGGVEKANAISKAIDMAHEKSKSA